MSWESIPHNSYNSPKTLWGFRFVNRSLGFRVYDELMFYLA